MEVKEKNILYNLKSEVWRLRSKVDRLEGRVDGLMYGAREHHKKIENLEDDVRRLEGLIIHVS